MVIVLHTPACVSPRMNQSFSDHGSRLHGSNALLHCCVCVARALTAAAHPRQLHQRHLHRCQHPSRRPLSTAAPARAQQDIMCMNATFGRHALWTLSSRLIPGSFSLWSAPQYLLRHVPRFDSMPQPGAAPMTSSILIVNWHLEHRSLCPPLCRTAPRPTHRQKTVASSSDPSSSSSELSPAMQSGLGVQSTRAHALFSQACFIHRNSVQSEQ